MILAIDPGNVQSAYVLIDENLKPIDFNKLDNKILLNKLIDDDFTSEYQHLVIEMIASYGMVVGKHVFDTCVWIGKFDQAIYGKNKQRHFMYRKDVKMNLCQSMKAKDSSIRRALIDRFAQHDYKNGKGTKKNPDWFYGFKADIWQAYALAVTYFEMNFAIYGGGYIPF